MKAAEKALVTKIAKRPNETLAHMSEDELASVIQLANIHYYNTDKPLFSDNTYDLIKEKMEAVNPYHPILKHVGAIVGDDERKTTLPYWMGSMDKLKGDSTALSKWVSAYNGSCVISDKLDGNSGMLHIKDGVARLFTRGNGVEGQNITHIMPFIAHIPDVANNKNITTELTVRGELIMSKSDFQTVKHLGANGRNMVAGLLNSKVPNLEIAKYVQFIAYELIVPRHEPSKQFKLLKELGFKVVSNSAMRSSNINAAALSKVLSERRASSEFEIDGIIVVHDGIHNRVVGENPKHAFAFKSVVMMDKAEVIVNGIEWNITKDGYIKPVVLFDAVSLSGAMVRRATGFNAKFIKESGIGPGAKIMVMRSGDVIPYITEVIDKATVSGLPDDIPFKWNESEVDIVVDVKQGNVNDEMRFKNIEYFFGKVKVTGLSSGILRKMYDANYDTIAKILAMKRQDLLKVDGFKDKMADKILTALTERLKTVDPITLMNASNMFGRGIGNTKITLVAAKFPAMLNDPNFIPTKASLLELDSIEDKTATKFLEGLKAYWKFAKENDLMKYHNAKKSPVKVAPPSPTNMQFAGMAFVFTGVRNKELEAYLTARSALIKSSVSKKTNMVLCKSLDDTSSKIKEARESNIPVMTIDAFMQKYHIII
jgi:DNA ligase (NAD+)